MRLPRTVGLAAVAALLASGCASLNFSDAGAPPESAPRYALAAWPYQEYWAGIVFNGAKIGFSQLRLAREAGPGELYRIESQAAFHLRFLGVEKKFQLRARDWVGADLTLVRFESDANMDGNELRIVAARDGARLRLTVSSRDHSETQELAHDGPLYPTSALYLYPVRHGLEVGRRYSYTVYDTELQQLAAVEQEILAYERSRLFDGPAYKVETRMLGQSTTTWIDARGLPLLELALDGVLISALEDEETAKRYLVAASLNKQDTLVDFSLVRLDRPIERPRERAALTVVLRGLPPALLPTPEARQHCVAHGADVRCALRRLEPKDGAVMNAAASVPARYLEPTLVAPSAHPRITQTARDIAGDASTALETTQRIVRWIDHHVEKQPIDVFSALDVLDGRRAECQGHTYLYTALARARGIPTRVVNGLAYSEEHQGFLYHTWAESWIAGGWVAVDPTFAQIGVDATHIKLLEAETPAELLPLVDVVGKLSARVEATPSDP